MLVAVMILPCATFASVIDAVHVTAGKKHTCARLVDNSVKCWGANGFGQLGLGDTNTRGDGTTTGAMGDSLLAVDLGTNSVTTQARTAKHVTAGGYHTCALLDNNSVKCWGRNNYGQLGLGDTDHRGDGSPAGAMGDNLLAVDLGYGRTAKHVTAGGYHTCALLDDDSVKCWGRSNYGQLGVGDPNKRGDGSAAGAMGDSLTAVDLGYGRTAKHVTAGYYHTCALLNDDSVKCWGEGENGRLGIGGSNDVGYGMGQMGDWLLAVNLGTNSVTNQGHTAKHVTAGDAHTCALLDDDSVKCWGKGDYGRLGLGDKYYGLGFTYDVGDNSPQGAMDLLDAVDLGTGRTAKHVTAGGEHTCALLDNNSVKCWGRNDDSGQLGLGDTDHRGDGSAAGAMGDSLLAVDLGTPPCTASQTATDDGTNGNFYCVNGGTVSGTAGACSCTGCLPGYSGASCEVPPTACTASQTATDDGTNGNFYCVNGGTVSGTAGACTCTGCSAGYSGASCQMSAAQDNTTLADEDLTPPPNPPMNATPAFLESPNNLVLDDDSHATSRYGASAMLTMPTLLLFLRL